MGSTEDALVAGTILAVAVTTNNTKPTASNMTGSSGAIGQRSPVVAATPTIDGRSGSEAITSVARP